MGKGVISLGITCPIIREGDNLIDIVTKAVLDEMTFVTDKGEKIYQVNNKDVIGITESVIDNPLLSFLSNWSITIPQFFLLKDE